VGRYFQTQNAKALRKASPAKAEPADKTLEREETNPVWQSLAFARSGLHPKLAVSRPDEPCEREADRIADRVMRMLSPQADTAQIPVTTVAPGRALAKCASCEEEDQRMRVQRKCGSCHEEDEEKNLKRKSGGGNHSMDSASRTLPGFASFGGSSGRPLDYATRSFFEPRFGRDFSDVRIHTGLAAAEAADSVGARAFTLDRNVVFGAGNFAPESQHGRWLIAHELAHVAQNAGSSSSQKIFRQPESSGGESASLPTGDIAAATPVEVELNPPHGAEIMWFRGVLIAEDEAFLRQQMQRLILDMGIEGADSWYRAMQGRPDFGLPLPFSAHTRGYGGMRPRSPLDARRDSEEERRRTFFAPVVDRVYRQVRTEALDFMGQFENRARDVTRDILRESEARVNAERIRYGLERESHEVRTYRGCHGDRDCATTTTQYTHRMANTASSQGLLGAARDLQAKQNEINAILRLRSTLVRSVTRRWGHEIETIEEISDHGRYNELTSQAEAKRQEYDLMLSLFQERYPILASIGRDPAAVNRLANAGVSPLGAAVLNEQIYETLNNINEVRSELVPGGDVDIWKLPEIVHLTKQATGATSDTILGRMHARLVDEEAHRLGFIRRLTGIAQAVLVIGLAVIAAIPTGGGSLAVAGTALAGLAAAGLSFYQAAQHLREFQLERAMTGTDFDRARAISTEEPSLFWLAVDIIGAALDVGPALRATRQLLQVGQRSFRALRELARRAVTATGADAAESLVALRRAAEGTEYGGARLAQRLEQTVERIRQAGGSPERALARAAGHEAQAAERAAAAIGREADRALASAPTRLGGHTVRVTPSGWLVRCTLCGQLREEFASELARNPDLATRLFATEERAARAASTGDRALANEATTEARQLADELEAFRRMRDVRLYRRLRAGSIEDVFLMDRRLVVDMPFVGRGAADTNAAGWLRDASYYWEELMRRHPQAFSPDNVARIRGTPPLPGRLSPINDVQFRTAFPQYDVRGLRGQPLIHHHIGGGGQAAAIPAPLHPGSGGVHNVERAAGIWGGEDEIAEMLQRLLNSTPPGGQ
jgi:hypothetical protein